MARCATDVANNAKNAGALKGYMWANKGTLIWATPTNLDMVESAADVKAGARCAAFYRQTAEDANRARIPIHGTDKTDRRAFVSFVSSLITRFSWIPVHPFGMKCCHRSPFMICGLIWMVSLGRPTVSCVITRKAW